MKNVLITLFLFLFPLDAALATQSKDAPIVLMLISGYGNESRPELSYDLEELAQAYLVLHDNGVKLDIATPQGGPVLIKNNKDNLPYIQRFKSLATTKLNKTLSVKNVVVDNYQGVFIVGGAGAMFDLPSDANTQSLLTDFAQQELLITAVCHGPAAIANIKLADGRYFVNGKQVNSFTNVEEQAFSGEHISQFPFLIENKLIENGGDFVHNDPMLPYVAVAENLITAQNPSSVPKAAEALVLKLGLTPAPRESFKDEATMNLLAKAKDTGAYAIDLALNTTPEKYDINFLALYGFYAYPLAEENKKSSELDLMTTIARYFEHPAYESAMIKALLEQGQLKKASSALNTFLQRYPTHGEAEVLKGLVKTSSL